GIGRSAGEVPEIEIGALVTLALEGKHGVRTGIDAGVKVAREVEAEKWKFGIGHGIDEGAYQVRSLRNQIVVFAAKGHDPDFGLLASHAADAVAVQPGTIDYIFRRKSSATGFDDHFRAAPDDGAHFRPGAHRAALISQDLGVFLADGSVVGDARARHQHAQQTAAVRLNFAQLFLLQQP